jgi:methylenetetrahydrofolate dehydrogenase (NADP+)/methenyltetrahydrofolate cyclohydrolase
MSAELLQGKQVSERVRADIKKRSTALLERRGTPPHLAILAIGGDAAARMYMRKKLDASTKVGVECTLEALPENISQNEVLRITQKLGQDPSVDAIILEMPVPEQIDPRALYDAIPPEKDVEGVSSVSLGRFYSEKSWRGFREQGLVMPCTAQAIIEMLLAGGRDVAGKNALVIGRSNIVGRPTAHLLSCLNATVTLAHSQTENLQEHIARADILVAAIGVPRFIKGAWIKEGAVVLDAGIHTDGKKMSGDVDFATAVERAAQITPVPGGIGPLTVSCLLRNTVWAAEQRTQNTLQD